MMEVSLMSITSHLKRSLLARTNGPRLLLPHSSSPSIMNFTLQCRLPVAAMASNAFTCENIWHECIEPRRRHSSVTDKGVTPDADGKIRIAIGQKDSGHGHWLDTGGRRRGFVVLRWLDNPAAPDVRVSVR